jgi:hypothetical protein
MKKKLFIPKRRRVAYLLPFTRAFISKNRERKWDNENA